MPNFVKHELNEKLNKYFDELKLSGIIDLNINTGTDFE
jgi:hypothetical protein